MSEDIRIIQKSAIGADNTQIGVQNNYGISAEEASQLAIKLFMDNFPRLQDEAKKVAEERAEELCKEIISKLNNSGKQTFEEFSEPDIQYVLYEAQKSYARFGGESTLEILSEIISTRVQVNKQNYIKRVLDKAVQIAALLTEEQLNYLSLSFMAKQVRFQNITKPEELKSLCEYVCAHLPIEKNITNTLSYLDMIGCFTLSLGDVKDIISKTYNIHVNDLENILPKQYEFISPDYNLTPAAIIIAIINAHRKTKFRFDMETWVHE